MSRPPTAAPVYIAHVVPGLERMASAFLREHHEDVRVIDVLQRFDERTSLLVFRTSEPPRTLLDPGMLEDVFALCADARDIPQGQSALPKIRGHISGSEALERAASLAWQVRARGGGKATFRVIARRAGQHAFRRVDLQKAVELGIQDHFPGWKLVADDARVEVWAHLVGSHLIAGIRLSDNTLRQRTYRKISLPAALKPTVAYAMAILSEPSPDDVFLDPMCGSGTVLIERAMAGRYRLLQGGDTDPGAVAATRANVGKRHQPIEIRQWDATLLPLDSGSVTALVTNLPFGKQMGTSRENRRLYPLLFAEWRRVLAPGGRMVLLTGDRANLRSTLQAHPELRVEQQIQVLIRGEQASIFVIR